MSTEKLLSGQDLLEVLDSSRNPLKLAAIRNEAITYIKENADRLPSGKSQACKDYLVNFNASKRMSDQLRDLAVWIDEMNAYIKESEISEGEEK